MWELEAAVGHFHDRPFMPAEDKYVCAMTLYIQIGELDMIYRARRCI